MVFVTESSKCYLFNFAFLLQKNLQKKARKDFTEAKIGQIKT